MVAITQCPSPDVLRRCAEHGASAEELLDLFGHLEHCSACASKLEEHFAASPLVQALRSGTTVEPPQSAALTALMERLRGLRPVAALANEETMAVLQPETVSTSGPTAVEEPTEAAIDFLGAPQQPGEIGRLGNYRVIKQLGAGGMGMVFLAEDVLLRRKVALKTMLPALAAKAVSKERFLREARSAAAVEHENVVAIHQVGEDRGVPYLAMAFLKGEALDDRLKRERALPIPEAVRIAAEMAEGLAAAHDLGLVHRDIKPGNVWLEGAKAKVKLLDFGLARAQLDDSRLTQSGAIVGTPAFMAPEQARSDEIDGRADLFSLGAVLYTMLTGNRPFQGNNTLSVLTSLALDNPPTPKTVRPEVSAEISDLTMKLLAKNVEGRPESARVAAAALREQMEVRSDKTAAYSPPWEEWTGDGASSSQATRPIAQADAISARHSQEREKTALHEASSAPKPRRSRGIYVAAALLFLLGGAFAAYQFVIKTPNGTFFVQIDDKEIEARFKNGELQILDKDGTVKYTLKADERRKNAPPGEYRMRIVGADGLTVKTDIFTLKKGETTTVRVELAPVAVAKNDPTPQVDATAVGKVPAFTTSQYALHFERKGSVGGSVQVPNFFVDLSRPFTMEGYLTVRDGDGSERGHLADPLRFDFAPGISTDWYACGMKIHANDSNGKRISDFVPSTIRLTIGRKTHMALVFTGRQFRLYVDGKMSAQKDLGELSLNKVKSPFTMGYLFTGEICEVRVSTVARYDKDFTPPTRYESDADTVGLYQFDEGQGEVLKDSSGKQNHGRIEGATWVKADGQPLTSPPHKMPSQAALQFVSKDSVKMSRLTVDLTGPRTLEGYVTPREGKNGDNYYPFPFVNSDGGMWSIVYWADDPNGKRKLTYVRSTIPVAFGRKIHLAMVFTGRQFRLYIDGKLATQKDLGDWSVQKITWPLELGFQFTGELSEIRISTVARYDKDFTPAKRFEADADTVGLYHIDEGQGEVLKDSSAKRNHGQIEGAKWVRSDGRPLNSPSHNAPSPYALHFDSDGKTWSSVPIRSLVPDFSRPCTMEGFVTARGGKGLNTPFICDGAVGITAEWGKWNASFWADEPNGNRKHSLEFGTFRPAVGKKTHLALVSTGREFQLYVDGILSARKEIGELSLERYKVNNFSIGRDFNGELSEVRVSKAARYDKDFTPPSSFQPDADTLGLYHFDEGQGEVLYDSSGNGHHGKIVGAKWVKVAELAAFDAWLKQVATLPVKEKLKAIKTELIKRNPGFDGEIRLHRVDQAGVPEEVHINTDAVTDISPLNALTGLKGLICTGNGHLKGQLVDLSPLKGTALTYLNCGYSKLSDLSSVKYVNLTDLTCRNTMVSDLTPLKNLKLTRLDCTSTPLVDLSPLKGMKLTNLFCGGGTKVADLSPLKGMPLTWLELGDTKVSDLSPLAGMPLTSLACNITKVSDLSPLKGMPLTKLSCNSTKVTDLSPLRGMPLVELQCDFQPERDAEILRSIKTLKKINGQSAAEFWSSTQEQPKQ